MDQNISNSLVNYEKKLSRLAYLEEQAEMARKLKFENGLVEARASINIGILSDLNTDIPYYLEVMK